MAADRDPALERRALQVLQEVLDAPPTTRHTRLTALCGADAALRRRALELLARADTAELDVAADLAELGALLDDAPRPVTGAIGGYEIIRAVGRGGMGEVYEARQRDPRRTVAIKVLRAGRFDVHARRRFAAEARVLAHLQHPAIARVIEAGVHTESAATGPREVPFLVLEFVPDARSIVDYAAQEGLSLAARVRLLAEVARAVHHGHQKGVIHRDLKPANLLVGTDGRPKVIDFGIARVVDDELAPRTLLTQTGQIVGTLGYIAPEVLADEAELADVRADVYALGAVAYQLVLGCGPFDLDDVALAEAARRVTTTPPLRPQDRDPSLDRDLAAVLLQSVARSPADRYASAATFADDLERWLGHVPVQARLPGPLRRLQLLARRNPPLATAVATLVVLVVGGALAFAALQADARAESDALRTVAERNSYVSGILAVNAMVDSGEIAEANATLRSVPEAFRAWEWRHLSRVLDCSVSTLRPFPDLAPEAGNLHDADYDAARGLVVVGNRHGQVRVLDASTGRVRRSLELGDDARFVRFAGATGRLLVSGYMRGRCRVVELATGEQHDLVDTATAGSIHTIAVSRDGRLGACAFAGSHQGGGEVAVFDLDSGEERRRLRHDQHPIVSLAFRAGGNELFAGSFDGRLLRWDLRGTATLPAVATDQRFRRHGNMVSELVVSPDGARVASGGGRHVAIWDGATLALQALISINPGQLAWAPDGEHLFVSERATPSIGTIRIQEGAASVESRAFGHEAAVHAMHVDADRGILVSAGADGTVRTWDLARLSAEQILLGHPRTVRAVATSADGRHLVSASSDGTVLLRDAGSGQPLAQLDAGDRVLNVRAHPGDGPFVVVGARIFLLDREARRLRRLEYDEHPDIADAAWHPDGGSFVTVDGVGAMVVWSRDGERLRQVVLEASGGMRTVDIDDSGQRIAVGTIEDRLYEFAFDDLTVLHTVGERIDRQGVAYVPGSRDIVEIAADQTLALWRRQPDDRLVRTELERGRLLQRVAFHPDEPRMFTASAKGRLSIWATDEWRRLVTMRGHGRMILALDFDATHDRLVTGSMDRTTRIWHVVPR